jgi:hypothetical protein
MLVRAVRTFPDSIARATDERLSVGVLSGLVLALTFATNPFLFEKKGWQFYTAFRAADPEIFANDRVIEKLADFWSA